MASEINPTEIRTSAFQTRLPLPNCNALVKCEESKSSLVAPMTSNSLRLTSNSNITPNNNNNNNNNANNNSNSPKMGSRRIFTPQFKLQVLESYRSDSDCKGNQRATARKYNIHRRQIQKWLQCESNLRSSVANINQNSVKHQFHNISHHHQHQNQHQQLNQPQQQQQHTSAQRLPLPIAVPTASLSSATNGYSHLHHHHNHPQVPLDAAHQTLVLNSLNVSSIPTARGRPVAPPSSATSAQGVLAANLAAAVAVAIASSSSSSPSTAAVSPLRPTAIGGATGVQVHSHHPHHHQHHHHHFPLSPYARSPVAAPVPVPVSVSASVPMLPHHISPSSQPHSALHHHHHHQQQHYPYHNLSPHTHAHALTLSHQASAFLPTTCLPVNVLSAVAVAAASTPANVTNTNTATDGQENEIEDNCTLIDANANVNVTVKDKLCEPTQHKATTKNATTITGMIKSMIAHPETINDTEITTTTTKSKTPATAVSLGSTSEHECSYTHESESDTHESVYRGAMYADSERMRDATFNDALQSWHYKYAEQVNLNTSMPSSPMDLSVGSRRKGREYFESSTGTSKTPLHKNAIDESNSIKCHLQQENNNISVGINDTCTSLHTQVVDLTFRKRKVVTACSVSTNYDTEQPLKLPKRLDDSDSQGKENACGARTSSSVSSNMVIAHTEGNDEEDDVEIEVEVDVDADADAEAKLQRSSKPVKLFKPYLLDDTDDPGEISNGNNNSNSDAHHLMNEQRDPIIWSNHPAFTYDGSRTSSLHSPNANNHTFPNGSPYFLTSKVSSPQSALSPTSAISLSPNNFPLRCPKGSPVSGYESSSSTCSERDDSYGYSAHDNGNRSFSLDFQMHTVCEDKVNKIHKPIHIQDWLDQDRNIDTNTPPLARASIALYA